MQGTIVGPHCQVIALGNMLSVCVLSCEVPWTTTLVRA